jgi:hypothetical protein
VGPRDRTLGRRLDPKRGRVSHTTERVGCQCERDRCPGPWNDPRCEALDPSGNTIARASNFVCSVGPHDRTLGQRLDPRTECVLSVTECVGCYCKSNRCSGPGDDPRCEAADSLTNGTVRAADLRSGRVQAIAYRVNVPITPPSNASPPTRTSLGTTSLRYVPCHLLLGAAQSRCPAIPGDQECADPPWRPAWLWCSGPPRKACLSSSIVMSSSVEGVGFETAASLDARVLQFQFAHAAMRTSPCSRSAAMQRRSSRVGIPHA